MIIQQKSRVLAVGAHPDDIELGAGGLIRRMVTQLEARVQFLILTKGLQHPRGSMQYSAESRQAESHRAAAILGVPSEDVTLLAFEDCRLPLCEHDVIREIEGRLRDGKGEPLVDVVLTHSPEDTHSDHRVASEATISAARDFHGTLLFYPSPSTKPNAFAPTFFVTLDEDAMQQKTLALQEHESQRDKEFMRGSRTRGVAAGWAQFLRLQDGFLEAFEVYKSFWG